ncbi:AsmA-like C-terminal region-containing protein [Tellurirhabdus bombi]|uniref:AsmA-like C-terminal region-containing protein n=1 Tax=Tellurirhabdus bombi TaxID=2907205 RepID=UPI001F1AD430|nr:AsmA-like C-terminal region-containing protein [Tellurirhabdus bombi]
MTRLSHWAKVLLAAAVIFLLVGLLIPLLLATVYKDQIVSTIREEFAQHSEQRLADFDVHFSLLRHFPRLSVAVDNVSIRDNISSAQSEVLGIRQAQVVIGLTDFLQKRWTIRRVLLKGLNYHQWVDSTGKKTALVWKAAKRQSSGAGKGHLVDIAALRIEDARITVENAYKSTGFALLVHHADLKGDLSKPALRLHGTLNGTVQHISSRKLKIFRQQPFTATASYDYNPATKTGTIHHTQLKANGSVIAFSGRHQKLPDQEHSLLDLRLSGAQPARILLTDLLPDSLKNYADDPALKRPFTFKFHMHGRSGPKTRPHSRMAFQFSARDYHWPQSPLVIQALQVQGEFDNGKKNTLETSTLTIQQFKMQADTNTISVQGRLTNLKSPVLEGTVIGNLSLTQMAHLMKWSGDSLYSGTASIDLALNSPLRPTGTSDSSLIEPFWKGTLQVRNGCFQVASESGHCTALNADIAFMQEDNLLQIREVSGKLDGRSFRINGEIRNLLRYWLQVGHKAYPVRSRLEAHWSEMDFSNLKLRRPAKNKPDKPSPPPDSLLSDFLFGAECLATVQVDKVRLPSRENLSNVFVRIHKQGELVRIPQVQCQTTYGGHIAGLGQFRLNQNGIQQPYAALTLSYPSLDLQNLFAFLSELNGVQTNYRRPTRKRKNELDYRFDLEVKANKLAYRALKGENFALKTVIRDEEARLERLTMNAFNGRLGARGVLKLNGPSANQYPVRLNVNLRQVDLYHLFRAADELQLDVFKSENIRGNLDCSIVYRAELDETFLPDLNRTTAYTRATLREMELINVEPIQQALHFLPKAKTSHIYFQDVEVRFLLAQNRIMTPGVNLTNNLSHLHLGGDYTLNQTGSFLVEVGLMDLLFGNNKRRIRQIQTVDSTRLGNSFKSRLFLQRGNSGKYHLKISGRRDFETRRNALRYRWASELGRQKIDTTFAR